jgi:hypothetical protein
MDSEKVHSIKHCHVDVTNFANPINCSCNGPEKGHKTWVHQLVLRTNQGDTSALTMMTHSLNKEVSLLLCDAMRCLFEDGDERAENWKDTGGRALQPDRFWSTPMESMIASGLCLGIELNIWKLAKVGFQLN